MKHSMIAFIALLFAVLVAEVAAAQKVYNSKVYDEYHNKCWPNKQFSGSKPCQAGPQYNVLLFNQMNPGDDKRFFQTDVDQHGIPYIERYTVLNFSSTKATQCYSPKQGYKGQTLCYYTPGFASYAPAQ